MLVAQQHTSPHRADRPRNGTRGTVEFAQVVDALRDDLELVEARLRRSAEVDYPLVGELLLAIIGSGGKRLRPILMILACRPFVYDQERLVVAAAGVEMLHTASLVHDDTIDRALMRRGQPTLNSVFNSETVILLGDYLFAQSAILATETMNPRVVAVFAQALGHICDGQLREIFTAHRVEQTREEYELRIFGKTASLFAGAAEMGALLGRADEAQVENLRAFGGEVGMAFQIVDDVLDLRSTSDELGKPVGSDLRQGTLTLPTMLYLENADGAAPAGLVRRIFDGDEVSEADFQSVATAIQESGALDASIEAARGYVERAKDRLAELPDPHTARYLATFADYALERVS